MALRYARQLCAEIRETVEHCGMLHAPHVVLILLGVDATASCYAEDFEDAARATSVGAIVRRMPWATTSDELRSIILSLNSNRSVHGIVLQLPLPAHCGDQTELLSLIAPEKDMDGPGEANLIRFFKDAQPVSASAPLPLSSFISPAIVLACEQVLRSFHILPARRHAPRPCIVLLGLPGCVEAALVLFLEMAGCDVQSKTHHAIPLDRSRPESWVAYADAIVIGARQPAMVSAPWVRSGTVIIDIGASTSCAPPRAPHDAPADGPIDHASVQRDVRCVSCHDGLSALIAAIRMHNACNAALLQQGFVEIREESASTPSVSTLRARGSVVAGKSFSHIDVQG